MRALIEAGADVDKACNACATPLYIGAKEGHIAVVRILIEAGADVNKKARFIHGTTMYIAAQQGHEAVVRALIEAGADVNKANQFDVTPLYIAARNGREEIVRALTQLGADVYKASNEGVTPLYVAAGEGHETVVRALTLARPLMRRVMMARRRSTRRARTGVRRESRCSTRARTSTWRWMATRRRCQSPLKRVTRR